MVVALALHLAEVGIIGLSVIILTTAFCGITEEHALGKAFEEALPFTALLTVFSLLLLLLLINNYLALLFSLFFKLQNPHNCLFLPLQWPIICYFR